MIGTDMIDRGLIAFMYPNLIQIEDKNLKLQEKSNRFVSFEAFHFFTTNQADKGPVPSWNLYSPFSVLSFSNSSKEIFVSLCI